MKKHIFKMSDLKGKMLKIVALSLFMLNLHSLNAKVNNGVILTVDGEEVPSEEFLYLYHKNNQQQLEPVSLDDYLKLFEIYRLKVAEAKTEGIDTTASFKKEMAQYRRELVEPYITDSIFINNLVAEAMERDKWEVESSHIMIVRTHVPSRDSLNLVLLDSLRTELLNGADFIQMAKRYSQDKFSSEKGGYLGFTPASTFPYDFETAEYETPEGEISDIISSHVGWHIIMAGSKKPVEEFNRSPRSYHEVKEDVLRKASSPFDSRFYAIKNNKTALLKSRHPHLISTLEDLDEDEVFEVLLSEEERSQYKNNPEYRNLVDEYINGSLLYEVSVKNIWDKASNDEEGLNKYFENNKEKYNWDKPRAKGLLVMAVNDSVANEIKTHIRNMPLREIPEFVKANFKKEAKVEKVNLSEGASPLVDYLAFGKGEKPEISTYREIFMVGTRIVDAPEELNDVRGAVIGDYQEALENQWVNNLRDKHRVEVNQKELQRIKKNLK